MRNPVSADFLSREIGRYDSADAARVSQRVRAISGREPMLDELVALYHEVIEEFDSAFDNEAMIEEGRAAAAYLRELSAGLAAREAYLDQIINSRSVRVLNRYGMLKRNFVTPVYNRIGNLMRLRLRNKISEPDSSFPIE